MGKWVFNLVYLIHMLPKMLGVKQKALSNMPHGKDMTMSSTLIYTSRKPVRCTEKLLKIKSKLILIPFTSFVDFFFFGSKYYRQDR